MPPKEKSPVTGADLERFAIQLDLVVKRLRIVSDAIGDNTIDSTNLKSMAVGMTNVTQFCAAVERGYFAWMTDRDMRAVFATHNDEDAAVTKAAAKKRKRVSGSQKKDVQ